MQRDNAVCGVGVAYNAKLGGIIYISMFIYNLCVIICCECFVCVHVFTYIIMYIKVYLHNISV